MPGSVCHPVSNARWYDSSEQKTWNFDLGLDLCRLCVEASGRIDRDGRLKWKISFKDKEMRRLLPWNDKNAMYAARGIEN